MITYIKPVINIFTIIFLGADDMHLKVLHISWTQINTSKIYCMLDSCKEMQSDMKHCLHLTKEMSSTYMGENL